MDHILSMMELHPRNFQVGFHCFVHRCFCSYIFTEYNWIAVIYGEKYGLYMLKVTHNNQYDMQRVLTWRMAVLLLEQLMENLIVAIWLL